MGTKIKLEVSSRLVLKDGSRKVEVEYPGVCFGWGEGYGFSLASAMFSNRLEPDANRVMFGSYIVRSVERKISPFASGLAKKLGKDKYTEVYYCVKVND